jgi:membrane protein implicated in regulation of membrane protease activity
MVPVLIWLVVAATLAVAEAFTTTFVLLMLSAGAFAAAGTAALGFGVVAQTAAFAVVSVLSLVLVRPMARRHFRRSGSQKAMGIQAIEGATAVVLDQIDGEHGLVKIEGEMWRARPYDAQQVIPAGERVRVVEVKGATVMVWRD